MSKFHKERPVFLLTSADVNAWLDTSSGKWSEELSDIAENRHNDNPSGVLS
jgi:putative SOS response-associated peptidase YedK